jgi:site-specific recombinase XerD
MEAKPKLLQVVRAKARAKHYSYRTEHAYVGWIRRFILFNGKRHPGEMGAIEVESFLTHLAVERQVSASTQNQALGAILFLYREVLDQDLPWIENVVRARRSMHLPVVLARREVQALLAQVEP